MASVESVPDISPCYTGLAGFVPHTYLIGHSGDAFKTRLILTGRRASCYLLVLGRQLQTRWDSSLSFIMLYSEALKEPLRDAQSFERVVQYIQMTRQLKDEIKLCMRGDIKRPPARLPAHIQDFVKAALHIGEAEALECWTNLKDIAWEEGQRGLTDEEISIFQTLGPQVNPVDKKQCLTHRLFYPPYRDCPTCGSCLTEPSKHEATLHTLRDGAVAVYTLSLYCRNKHCPAVNSRYYPNYSVRKDSELGGYVRSYYGGVPDVIQFEEHGFIEVALCEFFANMMSLAWASAANCATMYNFSLASASHSRPDFPFRWPNSFELDGPKVWHAFQLNALLHDWDERGERLEVPHDCTHNERLRTAIRERNRRLSELGDPVSMNHCCNLCCIYIPGEGHMGLARLDAIVHDGVTVGFACCAEHNCEVPLVSKHDRYCPEHARLSTICRVIDCPNLAENGFRSCTDPEHRAADVKNNEAGQSFFQLKNRLERSKISHPADVLATDESSNSSLDTCNDKPSDGNKKFRARWGRRFTHNEQLFIRPCGVIIARQTMYGAEAVSSVAKMYRRVFRTSDRLPCVSFYDNNCNFQKHVRAHEEEWEFFKRMIMPVDVFHFQNKHKGTDAFCQQHCNPALWPQLHDTEGKWVFNSSICEQTNVWVGGYHAMLREMTGDNYTFFLDEMIKRRNKNTIDKLRVRGHGPFEGMYL